MAEKLKPCPFCGGEADVHYFAHDDSECTVMCSNPNCRVSVNARSCGSMTTAYNRARKLWNRRADRTYHPERIGTAYHSALMCSACKHPLGEVTVYCPHCGARLESVSHGK